MLPEAEIAHVSPGRLRLRVPGRRGDIAFFERLLPALGQCPGVQTVQVTPLTGSVLVHHETEPGTIVEFGRTHELFEPATIVAQKPAPTGRLLEVARQFDVNLQARTGGAWSLKELAFVALSASGLVQMARSKVWPPAVSLLWYAAALLDRTDRRI